MKNLTILLPALLPYLIVVSAAPTPLHGLSTSSSRVLEARSPGGNNGEKRESGCFFGCHRRKNKKQPNTAPIATWNGKDSIIFEREQADPGSPASGKSILYGPPATDNRVRHNSPVDRQGLEGKSTPVHNDAYRDWKTVETPEEDVEDEPEEMEEEKLRPREKARNDIVLPAEDLDFSQSKVKDIEETRQKPKEIKNLDQFSWYNLPSGATRKPYNGPQ